MVELFAVTNAEIANELRREIRARERVFPKWVADGRLKKEVAARRLEILRVELKEVE